MIISEPHAMRWAIRPNKALFDVTWIKWHWTLESAFTLCHLPIVIGRENVPMFPECNDEIEKVNCKRCLNQLGRKI